MNGHDAGRGSDVRRAARAGEAARELRERLPVPAPRVAVILGSGLGGMADRFEEAVEIPYAEIPGWPRPAVEGHAGVLVAGRLGGVDALGLRGRAHLYEGHDPRDATLPVRTLAELGVRGLFLSNAAGVVNRSFRPGGLMLIADHLDLTRRSPLAGTEVTGPARRAAVAAPWDAALRRAAREGAGALGIDVYEGVYAAMLGPSFETPAEIRMLERLGADAVGMSTVPEALMAAAGGIRCFGASCLTNWAAGIGGEPLSHDEVIETTEAAADAFQRLVVEAVGRAAPLLG